MPDEKNKNEKNHHANTSQAGELKRFSGPGMMARWKTEVTVLQALQGLLPVPALLPHIQEAEILMKPFTGRPAVEMINEQNSTQLFSAIGSILSVIQSLPAQILHDSIPGNGNVIVHGDFSLQTLLFSGDPLKLELITGWEWANLGEQITDPAWMEWYVRMQMGKYAKDLPHFYNAYGSTPPWGERKDSMLNQVMRRLEFARMASEKRVIQYWQNSIQFTSRLQAL